jgi:hypothetical protein
MIYFTVITQQKFKVLFGNVAQIFFYKNILKNNCFNNPNPGQQMPRNSKNNSHTETKQISPTCTGRGKLNTILNMENYKWCLHNSLTHKCKSPVSLIMQISLLTIGSPVLLVSLTLGVPFAAQLQLYL